MNEDPQNNAGQAGGQTPVPAQQSEDDTNAGPGFAELGMMLLLAIGKDSLDAALDLAFGIGIVLNRITNFFIVAIFWLWCLFRLHKFPTKRFLATAGLKFIPILDALPAWTAFVVSLMVKKTVQSFGPASLEQTIELVGKKT